VNLTSLMKRSQVPLHGKGMAHFYTYHMVHVTRILTTGAAPTAKAIGNLNLVLEFVDRDWCLDLLK
jgi:hypothetical protein